MALPDHPPTPVPPLLALERRRLLDLLAGLPTEAWDAPTPCPGWDVLDLAAHLLGDDLGVLARHRDGHHGTVPPPGADEATFVAWLDGLQAGWVEAARRLSPRLVIDLLAWCGPQVEQALAAEDPTTRDALVSWASDEPVPRWLDQARELTEQWIHRQQVLEALGRPSDLRADGAGPVLDALRWAWPYGLRAVRRSAGSQVHVGVRGLPGTRGWVLVAQPDGGWEFGTGDRPAGAAVAGLDLTVEQAWRLLTNNWRAAVEGAVPAWGDREVTAALVTTRAIIGTPTTR